MSKFTRKKPKFNRKKTAENNGEKTAQKPEPNEFNIVKRHKMSNLDKELIKQYSALPDCLNSKYIAYMKAGWNGNKNHCIGVFKQKKIINGIKDYKRNNLIIPDPKPNPINGALPSLTEGITRRIEECFANGMSQMNTASVVGLNAMTLVDYMNKGESAIADGDLDNAYSRYAIRIKSAKARGEANLLDTIASAAHGKEFAEIREEEDATGLVKRITVKKRQWQAAGWLLERTRPSRYGRKIGEDPDEENANQTVEEQANERFDALSLLTQTTDAEDDNESDNGSNSDDDDFGDDI